MNNIINILFKESMKAYKKGEIPVSCIIIKNNKILSRAHNTKQNKHICINHAEINAIIKAEKKLKDWRLNDCVMYVTLEPCDMCKEVIKQSRIKEVYYLLPSKFNNENNKIINYKLIENQDNKYNEYLSIIKRFFNEKR